MGSAGERPWDASLGASDSHPLWEHLDSQPHPVGHSLPTRYQACPGGSARYLRAPLATRPNPLVGSNLDSYIACYAASTTHRSPPRQQRSPRGSSARRVRRHPRLGFWHQIASTCEYPHPLGLHPPRLASPSLVVNRLVTVNLTRPISHLGSGASPAHRQNTPARLNAPQFDMLIYLPPVLLFPYIVLLPRLARPRLSHSCALIPACTALSMQYLALSRGPVGPL